MINLKIDKKAYGNHVILEQTEITILEQDFIAIKGKSGCGKSTLLSMIGLLENFEGTYEFQTEKLTEKTKEKIRIDHFSYVFQKAYLIPYI
nr:ATP-binding cassette domain-containing protein [Anaeroplasmataceae bacterium]